MANSYNLTTASAGQNTVAVPFAFVDRLHVALAINGVAVTNFTWLSDSMIQLAAPLAGGERVYVYRATPDVTAVVTYSPGTITSKNLNDQTRQLLYVVQEAKDRSTQGMTVDLATNTYSAQGLRVSEVAVPVAANDAVNKAYADTIIVQATVVYDATVVLRNAVSGDRTQTGADRVATGQDRAAVSQSLLDANAAALLASKYADNPENNLVVTGRYSAMHWALKAAASAATAAASWVTQVLGFANKATPIDADIIGYVQASNSTGVKMTWANLKTTLAALFLRFDAAQTLSTAQKTQALANIGGLPIADPTFTGRVEGPTHRVDGTFGFFKDGGGTPVWMFDTGDSIRYDKVDNSWVFYIDGVEKSRIFSDGNYRSSALGFLGDRSGPVRMGANNYVDAFTPNFVDVDYSNGVLTGVKLYGGVSVDKRVGGYWWRRVQQRSAIDLIWYDVGAV